MESEEGIYLEFDAENSQKLDAELQSKGIRTTNVDELWRCDHENTKKFAKFANIKLPDGGE